MRFVSQQLNSINNERAPAGFPQLFTASLPQHSYSHCPTLLRRQSSRIESKIQKLGRRVGHTLFGVNESCRASESEPPPPHKFGPGGTLARPQWPSFLCLLSQWGREPACPTRNTGPRTFPRVFIFVFSCVSEERGHKFIWKLFIDLRVNIER